MRIPTPGFRARDGQRLLGTFRTRVEAAIAFARSQMEQREEKHHARKDDRRRGKKRKSGVELEKPEQAANHTHAAADAHYDPSEAQRYTDRNAQIQNDLASRCLELLCVSPRHKLLLDLGCGSGLSAIAIEAAGHTWIGVDVAREMLLLAAADERSGSCGGLIQGDLGALPLRSRAHIDGAIR